MSLGNYLRAVALVVLIGAIILLLRLERGDTPSDDGAREEIGLNAPSSSPRKLGHQAQQQAPFAPSDPANQRPVGARISGPSETSSVVEGRTHTEVQSSPDAAAGPESSDQHDSAPLPDGNPDGERKPVPIMPQIQKALRDFDRSDIPTLVAAREHRKKMDADPENHWSQDTEARLRQYLAAQPEANRIEALVACRGTRCLIQMAERERIRPGTNPGTPASQSVWYRMQAEPWFRLTLEHIVSQVFAVDDQPFFVGHFERTQ